MKIATVIGTRPEIIKMSRLIPLLDKKFNHTFIFTNQHYSPEMCSIFFEELGVRKPDRMLGVNSSDTALLRKCIQDALDEAKPDIVLVYGDTNSTLAAAMAAKDFGAKLVHIEAGLRSFDSRMPEEFNRVETDKLSDIFFTPTDITKSFLEKEGVLKNVHVSGNTIVDACTFYAANMDSDILRRLDISDYVLFTAHRQENVDDVVRLEKILKALELIDADIVYPAHPRTKKMLEGFGMTVPDNVILIEPEGYLNFLALLKNSRAVITDSGGVQEEAITLKVPCITIRETTERWETLLAGANFLAGVEPMLVSYYAKIILETNYKDRMKNIENPYGNGAASEFIALQLGSCVS